MPVDAESAPRVQPEGRGAARPRRARAEGGQEAGAVLLGHLERALQAELGALSAGAQELVRQVREGVAALEPGPGGVVLAPKEQQARCAQVGQALDELEAVLEALQLAARAARSPGAGQARGEG